MSRAGIEFFRIQVGVENMCMKEAERDYDICFKRIIHRRDSAIVHVILVPFFYFLIIA